MYISHLSDSPGARYPGWFLYIDGVGLAWFLQQESAEWEAFSPSQPGGGG